MKTDQAFSTILSTKIQRLNAYQTVMRLAVAAASRNFELLRTVGKVASTFECELGCRCLYENGVSLQVSELCVYATYLVRYMCEQEGWLLNVGKLGAPL